MAKVNIKTPEEIMKMRKAGILLSSVMETVVAAVKPGVTTKELDALAYQMIMDNGARPSFLGYHGFPATLCMSVDDEVVHGFPSDKPLEEGQILSIDSGLILDGWQSDHAKTVPVGTINKKAADLIKITTDCLYRGIDKMVVGNRLGDVGYAVQELAEAHGYSVVRDMCGHGIGRKMHEPPQLPNYGYPGTGLALKAGMVIAIEPMINIGTWQITTLENGWTTVTADGSLSAHMEHTVAVTDEGPVILSRPKDQADKF